MMKYLSVSGVAPSSISRRVMLGDSMKNSFVSRDYHHGKHYQPRLWKMMFLWERFFFGLGTICWISGLWKCHWGLPSSLRCLAKAHSWERILVTRPAIIIHDLPIALCKSNMEYGWIWPIHGFHWWDDDMMIWQRLVVEKGDGTPIFFEAGGSARTIFVRALNCRISLDGNLGNQIDQPKQTNVHDITDWFARYNMV